MRKIIALAPGGGVDTTGRLLAARLSEAWGQSIVGDNRPGAGGAIAAEALVRSLEAAAKGDVFDRAVEVGPDEHHTVREIAELVKELTGSQSEIVSLPPRPGEQFVPVMADTSTLALVGMKASDLVSVREGMALTIPYYRNPP
jgi:nucleoside-diphosphate-sugar epimerase